MRKLVRFALPFLAACAASVYLLSSSVMLIAAACCAALCAASCFLRLGQRQALCLLLAGLTAGFGWTGLYAKLYMEPIHLAAQQEAVLTAELCDYPFESAYGFGMDLRLPVAGRTVRARVYASGEVPELAPGDLVTGSFRLRPSIKEDDAENALYYQSKGFLLRGSVKNPAFTRTDRLRWYDLPVRAAHGIRGLLQAALPEDAAGYFQALLTGDKSGLSYGTKYDMSVAGISHTVAISGMHVSIMLAALWLLFGRNAKRIALIGIPVLLFFAAMTGASPSVVRAVVVQTLVLLAPLLRREADFPTSLCAAGLLILLQNPWAIADVSFQLSFAAMTGILLCTQPLYARLSARTERAARIRVLAWILRRILVIVSSTLGALVFTTPLIALHFGRFSLYGLFTNLLVLPVVSVCFVGGLCITALSLVWLPAGRLLGWLIAWVVRYILWVSHAVAGLPFASLDTGKPIFAVLLLSAYLMLLLCLLLRPKRLLLPTLGTLGMLGLALFFNWRQAQPGAFCVTALDVGQGQCVLLRTEEFTAVADCGGSYPEEAGTRAAEYLSAAGTRPIDVLVISHYDLDHAGGAAELMTRRAVRRLCLPDVEDPSGTRALLEQTASQTGAEICYIREDTTFSFADGTLSVFAPVSGKSDNDACLCVLFSVPECTALLTADLPIRAEKLLLQTHELPDTDLYVAGHHGSKSSSGEELLAQIRPEIVLVSVGTNHYGQPSEEALARFAAVGAELYRTDELGDIVIRR